MPNDPVLTRSGIPSDESPEEAARAAACEQVRAHLVMLRGGAPFLSPKDADLLLRWLDDGHAPSTIVAALEQAADHRRAKRLRAPLTLAHAKRLLGRTRGTPAPVAAEAPHPAPRAGHPLDPILAELASTPLAAHAPGAVATLADALRALPASPDLADRALATIADGLARTWNALGAAGRARYLDRARDALADLLPVLDEAKGEALVEEHARGLLREDVPCLAASVVLQQVEP